MRFFILGFLLVAAAIVIVAGPRGQKTNNRPIELFNDMDRQSKVKYQVRSKFFADGHGARMPVEGTVPLGLARPGTADPAQIQQKFIYSSGEGYISTGKFGDVWGDGIPKDFVVDAAFLELGQERYNINCKVCHGANGDGAGVTTKYGLVGVPSFHDERLRGLPDGDLYNTITHGKGLMFPYGANLTLEQRWAVVAYVRALQRVQQGTVSDLSGAELDELNRDKSAAAEPATPQS